MTLVVTPVPGRRSRRPRERLPRVETRFREVEHMLATGSSTTAITRSLMASGLCRRSAFRYLACALERLRREAGEVDREIWRARLQGLALGTYSAAMGRTRALAVACGDGRAEVHKYEDPDASGASAALRVLAALAGLQGGDRGSTTSITVHAPIIGDAALDALSRFFVGPAADAQPRSIVDTHAEPVSRQLAAVAPSQAPERAP